MPSVLTDRFEIVRVLGKGGMGIVYLARDRRLGREVAVKLVLHLDRYLIRRFEREARLLASLEHEHIVRLYDFGVTDGTPYLVMEYVRGKPLSARLASGRPTLLEAVRIALDVLEAVDHAHAREIVHRDLKPGNVFLDESGKAKVADFGLARAPRHDQGPQEDETQQGAILGTVGYMAPEQAQGERVGPAADVYSVGVILHEMLTGRRLFTGDNPLAIILAQRRAVPVAPSRVNPCIPAALDHVVESALARRPESRPSARQLADSVSTWLAQATAVRRPTGSLGFPPRPYKLLEHFGPEDSPIFFGRQAETAELVELLESPRLRLLFVFGPCGIGKSSLLRAGVVAGLDPARHDPLVLLSGPDPARILREALAARAVAHRLTLGSGEPITPQSIEMEPRLIVDVVSMLHAQTSKTLVVILDQLEEVFTQNPRLSPRVETLFETVALLVEAQALRLKVVLSYRIEFRGELFSLEERLARYQRPVLVNEITGAGLVEACEGPSRIEQYGFRYEPGLPQRLASDILRTTCERGNPALPCMQITCTQLYHRMKAAGRNVIDGDLYASVLGGVEGALQRYVEERLTSPEYAYSSGMARQMLKALTVKEEGKERFARALDEDDLLAFPDGERARVVLERLIADHLVVRSAGADNIRRVGLASEVMCPLIDTWLLEPDEAERAARSLTRSFRHWHENGRQAEHLLSGDTLALVRRQRSVLKDLSDAHGQFIEESIAWGKRRRLTVAFRIGIVVALLAAIVFLTFVRPTRLVLDTSPSGAEVFHVLGLKPPGSREVFEKQFVGHTPLTWSVRPGVYTVALRKRHHETVKFDVRVGPGGLRYKVVLPCPYGFLFVRTEPSGVTCEIRSVGKSPALTRTLGAEDESGTSVLQTPFTTQLLEGLYDLSFTRPGYLRREVRAVRIEPNRALMSLPTVVLGR
ncbi:MAG: serine/threonine-protein kinase PknK [Candidatus Riflebacteria bacterium]|nr:serine/threonine-protein kinase PknK [Candidatus Riflebacteria bacterium]